VLTSSCTEPISSCTRTPNPTPSVPVAAVRTNQISPRTNPTNSTPGSFRKTLYGGDSAPSPLRMPATRNPTTDRASIRAIFTSPNWARRGLGTMMMRHCEERARTGKPGVISGFSHIEMGATLSGVALYEKCGYVRSGREDVVTCPNGEGIRVVHMTKNLVALIA
jgi:hypothetical protein